MTEPEWDSLDSMAYQRGLEDGAAAERERLRVLIGERFKTVLAWPANGYLVDAVPWAQLLEVLGPGADLFKPTPSAEGDHQ